MLGSTFGLAGRAVDGAKSSGAAQGAAGVRSEVWKVWPVPLTELYETPGEQAGALHLVSMQQG